MPLVTLTTFKKSGQTVYMPKILSQERRLSLALRTLVQVAGRQHDKKKTPFCDCLVSVLLDTFKRTGGAYERRQELHSSADNHRTF